MAQLNFKGKQFVQNHHLVVPYHELIPQKGKGLTKKVSLHNNLIIHGDNLLALKALLPTYAGKIKCIYIDPPYNTGNEKWKYNDNVNSPMMQEWLKSNTPVDKDDLTRHDKWLCMMTPRLKLLKELLREDGVIFISIDDSEIHHLRVLMDEIFGEENFISEIVWRKRPNPPNDSKFVGRLHEYVICYRRTAEIVNFTKMERIDLSVYTNPDDDPKGDWKSTPLILTSTQSRKNLTYEVTSPAGKKFIHPSGWRIEKSLFNELDKKGEIYWGQNNSMPVRKRYMSEDKGIILNSLVLNFGNTITARKEIKEIFGSLVFETPKPSLLIKTLISMSTNKDSIILDSFAGSGTTAHATLQLNKEDGGNRKFILVEMEDYADNITAERVRRVIKGYSDKEGTGGTFSYFDLGKPIEIESLLSGKNLPNYNDLARYVFYTATGEEFDDSKVDQKRNFIGESENYEVFLFYKPDLEYLKNTALTLDRAKILGKINGKRRLVFAPTKYLDQEHLDELRIDFAQLPFEIYKLAK